MSYGKDDAGEKIPGLLRKLGANTPLGKAYLDWKASEGKVWPHFSLETLSELRGLNLKSFGFESGFINTIPA